MDVPIKSRDVIVDFQSKVYYCIIVVLLLLIIVYIAFKGWRKGERPYN